MSLAAVDPAMLLMLTEVVVVMPIGTMVTVGWRTALAVRVGR